MPPAITGGTFSCDTSYVRKRILVRYLFSCQSCSWLLINTTLQTSLSQIRILWTKSEQLGVQPVSLWKIVKNLNSNYRNAVYPITIGMTAISVFFLTVSATRQKEGIVMMTSQSWGGKMTKNQIIKQQWLLYYNRVLWEQGLIDEKTYRQMGQTIRNQLSKKHWFVDIKFVSLLSITLPTHYYLHSHLKHQYKHVDRQFYVTNCVMSNS